MHSSKRIPLLVLAVVMGVNIGNMFYSQSRFCVISEGLNLSVGQGFWVAVFLQMGFPSLLFVLPAILGSSSAA